MTYSHDLDTLDKYDEFWDDIEDNWVHPNDYDYFCDLMNGRDPDFDEPIVDEEADPFDLLVDEEAYILEHGRWQELCAIDPECARHNERLRMKFRKRSRGRARDLLKRKNSDIKLKKHLKRSTNIMVRRSDRRILRGYKGISIKDGELLPILEADYYYDYDTIFIHSTDLEPQFMGIYNRDWKLSNLYLGSRLIRMIKAGVGRPWNDVVSEIFGKHSKGRSFWFIFQRLTNGEEGPAYNHGILDVCDLTINADGILEPAPKPPVLDIPTSRTVLVTWEELVATRISPERMQVLEEEVYEEVRAMGLVAA